MKICDKCGAQQSDARVFCIDCEERLGISLSENRLCEIEQEMEKRYHKRNSLYVSVFDKIVGIASLIGLLANLIFIIVFRHKIETVSGFGYSILFFACSSLDALIPKMLWQLNKFRLSFIISAADAAEPSRVYLITRKIVVYGFFVIGVIFLAVTILYTVYPPEIVPGYSYLY